MIKKRCLDYYVDIENNWVLDFEKHYIYCQFHYDTRLKEDKNGFIVCEECNKILKNNGDLR